MNLLICAGHTLKGKGTGAVGFINESEENRILSNIVVKYLKQAGHTVDYYEINEADDYLYKQVSNANAKNYDLVVQIHFNAYATTSSEMGTETLYVSSSGSAWAEKINAKLSTMFKNRGIKKRTDLYWLNNTKSVAVLIETCFVDSKADTDKYLANKEVVGKLIAEGIHGATIAGTTIADSTSSSDTNTYYRVITGSYAQRENAEAQVEKLQNEGHDSFIDIYTK